jgi:hypothetical protein
MLNTAGLAIDHQYLFYRIMLKTFMQHTFSNHAGDAGYNYFDLHYAKVNFQP